MKIDIYKIYNDDVSYIGSSHRFKKRMNNHKSDCCNEKSSKYNLFIYQYIRQHGGWDAFTKEIIHTCEVADETEQRMVEQEWIKNNECKLNMCRSYQTKEERKEQTKQYKKQQKYKEQQKKYREANEEKIKEYQQEYNQTNKEKLKQKITCQCGSTYRKSDKTQHERSIKHIQFMESK